MIVLHVFKVHINRYLMTRVVSNERWLVTNELHAFGTFVDAICGIQTRY